MRLNRAYCWLLKSQLSRYTSRLLLMFLPVTQSGRCNCRGSQEGWLTKDGQASCGNDEQGRRRHPGYPGTSIKDSEAALCTHGGVLVPAFASPVSPRRSRACACGSARRGRAPPPRVAGRSCRSRGSSPKSRTCRPRTASLLEIRSPESGGNARYWFDDPTSVNSW
jgi:hypothetical protein